MKPEAQRIAIAKACGWIECETHYPSGELMEEDPPPFQRGKLNTDGLWEQLPNYLHDLNAMHEAEKVLTHDQWPVYFGKFPNGETWIKTCMGATAAQRAEAFLKTIGKWVEDSEPVTA